MSGRVDGRGASAESVPPNIIIPAVSVTAVVVLIVFALAVFAFLRSSRGRQRCQSQRSGGESLVSRWLDTTSSLDEGATWRDVDLESNPRSAKSSGLSSSPFYKAPGFGLGSPFAARNNSSIKSPDPVAHRPRSWNSRGSVFRKSGPDRIADDFDFGCCGFSRCTTGQATATTTTTTTTTTTKTDVNSVEVALVGVATSTMPSYTTGLSKLERMTGTQLSNKLFEENASGGHEASQLPSGFRAMRNLIYPQINTNISVPRHRRGSSLDTNISPTTVGEFEFSPASPTDATALAPPPPPPPPASAAHLSAIYPNIAALTQTDVTVGGEFLLRRAPDRTPSASPAPPTAPPSPTTVPPIEPSTPPPSSPAPAQARREPNSREHIASQSNLPSVRERLRLARTSTASSIQRHGSSHLDAPLSAAFGGFTGLDRMGSETSRVSLGSSISTFRFDTVEEDPPPPLPTASERHSWSGRSVLLLDDAPSSHRPTIPLINTAPDRQLLSPPPPPLLAPSTPPMTPQDVAWKEAESASLHSLHSCVSSSLNSVSYISCDGGGGGGGGGSGGMRLCEGLSPAPRHNRLSSDGASTYSHARTELELEMEMKRIRDRAQRASYERKLRRRREEEEEVGSENYQPVKTSFMFL